MQLRKPLVICIHPYGHIDPTRSQTEMRGLNQYLTAAVELVARNSHRLAAVIVPGGIKDKYNIYEADSLSDELKRRFNKAGISVEVVQDRIPKSTISIVKRAFQLIQQSPNFAGAELYLVSDNWRRLKTSYLAWRFHGIVPYKVFGFYREDTNPHSNHFFQFIELMMMVINLERVRLRIESSRQ